jgi:hypothetical protein
LDERWIEPERQRAIGAEYRRIRTVEEQTEQNSGHALEESSGAAERQTAQQKKRTRSARAMDKHDHQSYGMVKRTVAVRRRNRGPIGEAAEKWSD